VVSFRVRGSARFVLHAIELCAIQIKLTLHHLIGRN
jgi:hypothetical protein